MTFTPAIKCLSVATALAFAGCMNTPEEPAPASNASKASFVRALGMNSAEAARISTDPGFDLEVTAKQIRDFGCPKLADLFEDFNAPTETGELPKSYNSVLSCFDIGDLTDEEARDEIQKKFEDLTGVLDCVCGGTALSALLNGDAAKISAFSAANSQAAASSFAASSSNAGAKFDGASSNLGGKTYTSGSSNTYTNP